MTPQHLVQDYLTKNYRIVVWPMIGDSKGPREKGWPEHQYTLADYSDGYRVGILTGTEVAPGKFIHDVDIDWTPGSLIAQRLLPASDFIFGRSSKKISHCFYLTPEPIPSFRYEDIDKSCLIELRGTMVSGGIGLQTMVPPSVWSKEGKQEPLQFVRMGEPGYEQVNVLRQRICLSAIGMLLAKHLGANGFGHEPRLAWAGFMLRLGIPVADLVAMGEGISTYTNNLEVDDVRRTVEGTAARMTDPKQKIKGAPALAKILGEKGAAVIARIKEWLGQDSDFIRDADGRIIKDSQENIRRAIGLYEIELTHQMFAEKLLFKEPNRPVAVLTDAKITDMWLRIDREYMFRPSYVFFEKVIMQMAHENPFHPVRIYLDGLVWDQVPRIDQWLEKYGGSDDSEYHRAISSIVLIAAVRRIRSPGCKYDEMLVLESEQGLNKSSALRALCPNDDWFSDDLPLNVESKQIIEQTLGKWIIEASDLTGGRKADRDHLKSMLSRQSDGPARMAYARFPVERQRQFIIVGTTNSKSYLADPTGARRFWPVTIRRFNVDAIVRDRDQLWAEAVYREARGESIRLPERLWDIAGQHQEARREVDAWEELLLDAVENIEVSTTGVRRVSANTIWGLIGIEPSRRDTFGARRISEIMQRLGYERTRLKEEGKTVIGYVSRPVNLVFDEEQ